MGGGGARAPRAPPPRLCHCILRAIKSVLLLSPHDYNNVMLWAVVCVVFFGFLRYGEFVQKSTTSTVHLTPLDVAVDSHSQPSAVRLHIKRSKANQFGSGAQIFLARTGTDLCPVSALLAYLARRPNLN